MVLRFLDATDHNKWNKTGSVRITWQWGALKKPLLQWNKNKCYIFLCVCAHVPVHACACMCWCGCGCGCTGWGTGLRLRAFSLTYPECNARAPYCLRHDFRKNVTDYKTCVLIFFTTFVWNISHHKKNSQKHCNKVHIKYPLFFFGFNKTLIF
jgi:hypothetical protein